MLLVRHEAGQEDVPSATVIAKTQCILAQEYRKYKENRNFPCFPAVLDCYGKSTNKPYFFRVLVSLKELPGRGLWNCGSKAADHIRSCLPEGQYVRMILFFPA